MSSQLERFRIDVCIEIERTLDAMLSPSAAAPGRLNEAMRYSVLAGGKRVRPLLVVLAGEAFGGERRALVYGGAAIELIHAFSLVHDDLPALDDDALRRGRPTVHRQFGEATAILAGDALLAHGLTLLAAGPEGVPAELRLRAVTLLGGAVGVDGMIGGQIEDLDAAERRPQTADTAVETIHRRKTGKLLTAALRLGGLYAGAGSDGDERLTALGERIGLLFQIADDLLDVEGSVETLGKAAGKDAGARKLTYVSAFGVTESRRRLVALRDEALGLAAELPARRGLFAELIRFLASRDH